MLGPICCAAGPLIAPRQCPEQWVGTGGWVGMVRWVWMRGGGVGAEVPQLSDVAVCNPGDLAMLSMCRAVLVWTEMLDL